MTCIKIVALIKDGVPQGGYTKDSMTKQDLAVLILEIENHLNKLKEEYNSGGLEIGNRRT